MTLMRMALDARTIYRDERRGTGKNLIDLYRELAVIRPHWRVLGYHRNKQPGELPLSRTVIEPRLVEMLGDRLDAWQRWRLPLAAWHDGADVLHCPANTCPTWMPVPTVVTIHDLIPLDLPQGRSSFQVRRFEQSVRVACRRAAGVVCPSVYTRDRLIAEFQADPLRMTVIPWAPDRSLRLLQPEQCQPVLNRYGVRRPYVMHLGAAAPRKNTRRVIESWAILEASLRRRWALVVIGLDSTTLSLMRQLAEDLRVTESVALHGFAPEEDLSALFSAAEVLAYPSLAEGFGLPILDAWATNTAVLTSDRTSLPEIAGDAAALVDPTDPWVIAKTLGKLITDPLERDTLTRRGRRELTKYSWRGTAERFAAAMEAAANVAGKLKIAA